MWKEPYTYGADFLPLVGASGTAFSEFSIKMDTDAHFEAIKTIFMATDNQINVGLLNATSGRDIIRPKGDIRAVSSTALNAMTANTFLPYVFPIPYVFSAGSEVVVSASDKSGSSNNLRFNIHGNRIMPGNAPYEKRKQREHYSFAIDSGSVSGYGNVTKSFLLDVDAGFLCSKLTGTSTGEGTVFITDIKPWSSRDVHFYNMVGNAQYGNHLSSRRWLPERTMLQVRFTDISGSTNRFRITFHGERVYV